jgi:hypothetical protein
MRYVEGTLSRKYHLSTLLDAPGDIHIGHCFLIVYTPTVYLAHTYPRYLPRGAR